MVHSRRCGTGGRVIGESGIRCRNNLPAAAPCGDMPNVLRHVSIASPSGPTAPNGTISTGRPWVTTKASKRSSPHSLIPIFLTNGVQWEYSRKSTRITSCGRVAWTSSSETWCLACR